jgi:hypothetical protein
VSISNNLTLHSFCNQSTGDNAGVILLVGKYILAFLNERRNNALVRLIAGAKKKARLLTEEFRKLRLKLIMQIKCSIEIAGA